jgi:hypothetical protein
MRWRGVMTVAAVVAVGMVTTTTAGCTTEPGRPAGAGGPGPGRQPPGTAPPPGTGFPAEPVSVVPGQAPAELAIGASRVLYRDTSIVLLAGVDDRPGQAAAAPVAVGLGVPLLLTPLAAGGDPAGDPAAESPEPADPDLSEELARLDPAAVLAFGAGPLRWARQWAGAAAVMPAPEDPAVLAGVTGVPLGESRSVTGAELAAAVAALDRDRPARLTLPPPEPPPEGPAGPPDPATSTDPAPPAGPGAARGLGSAPSPVPAPPLPPVTLPNPLTSLTVLAPAGAEPVAAVATARAAGARVLVTPAADPRADPAVITALASQPPSHLLALGDRFGPADRLRDRQAVALTGVELPGGGQVVFPGRRFVALYGHPDTPVLGVLGEQPLDEAIARAGRVAADYRPLFDEPVVPALEIITTVASAGAGPAGDYSRRTPVSQLRPWVDAAGAAGVYVVLDLQPGHTDFLSQAQEYQELLREPHVGLALDPEWRLAPGQRHLAQIGSVDAAEVNRVIEWLAGLVARHRLPQKLLVLHQFTIHMIADRRELDTGRDELAVLVHVDGFGTPGQKLNTWNTLHRDQPPGLWWGWKNFYDEDQPTFTPARTVEVDPSPRFISYQ